MSLYTYHKILIQSITGDHAYKMSFATGGHTIVIILVFHQYTNSFRLEMADSNKIRINSDIQTEP